MGNSVLRFEIEVGCKGYSEAVVLIVKSNFAGREDVHLRVMS